MGLVEGKVGGGIGWIWGVMITGRTGGRGGGIGVGAGCAPALPARQASKASRRQAAMNRSFPRNGVPFFIAHPAASR